MSLKYERRLLSHLRHEDYQPATIDVLAEDLNIPADERPEFRAAVEDLASRGMLALEGAGGGGGGNGGGSGGGAESGEKKVHLPKMGKEVVGVFRKNPRGFGFIVPETAYREGDLFVPPHATLDAISGDTVRAAVERKYRGADRSVSGEIVEVISRKRANFTGELVKQGQLFVVYPDGRELTQPIVVADPSVKNARPGDKVVVEIVQYPEGDALAEGVITKVLGEAGLPDVETQAVIAAHNLPGEFPREVVDEARQINRDFERQVDEIEKSGGAKKYEDRLDLRDTFIITIDPPDAKDYDDAISIRKRSEAEGGGWELGVHIADVGSFIKEGTALDEEAKKRGNSCYLPRLVIPMLPEVLSNGICSLAEGVVRYTKSAFMVYDARGRCVREGVASTVIKSAKRLTYLEAQALIDGDLKEAVKHAKTEPKYTDQLIQAVREMDKCSRAILSRRRAAGMIHLELPEVNLIFNEAGHVVDAEPEDDAYTHTLIEMFMVEANEVLARLFEGLEVPLLRRIHPEPTPGDVTDLRTAAKVAGFSIPKSPSREELQALLDATRDTDAVRAVHMAVLRTLSKAEYSPAQVGHFALASEAYAHFTSPIRRYPDLTVHRALGEYLKLTDNGEKRPKSDEEKKRLGKKLLDSGKVPDFETLREIGRHCSTTEVNAEEAERELRQFLVLQLLSNHVGEAFDGIVTGVTQRGVFVQLEKYLCDGMIKSEDLPTGKPSHADTGKEGGGYRGGRGGGGGGGGWKVDQRSGTLVHSSGRSFSMGDRVKVTIANIDLATRKMDLVVADSAARGVGKDKKPKSSRSEALGSAGGLGGGGIKLDWETIKYGKSGSQRRSQKSKSRERGKSDFRAKRKEKGKGQ